MMNISTGYPSEDELHKRIKRQLEWRGPSSTVALLWRGYLTALLEWGKIEIQVYDRLIELLPQVGNKELYELTMDEPLSPEIEREIDEYLQGPHV